MPRFMLLIRGGDERQMEYTPEQIQQVIQRYIAWADTLRREGRHHGGDELAAGGRTVRLRDGRPVVDGPFTETKESVGGYFIIEAASEDEAAEIAKECPAVAMGGVVEVRQVNEH